MKQTKSQDPPDMRTVVTNRKARYNYHIDQKWEAGLVLRGTEVKSLRAGVGSLIDSYGEAIAGELWLSNFYIPPYVKGNRFNVDSRRRRKLLLRKPEIKKIIGAISQKGYSLIPLRVYFLGQHAKVEIALARGKKIYDKRRDMKEREAKREMDRVRKDLR